MCGENQPPLAHVYASNETTRLTDEVSIISRALSEHTLSRGLWPHVDLLTWAQGAEIMAEYTVIREVKAHPSVNKASSC